MCTMQVSLVSLPGACRGLTVYTCQLLCRKQFSLVCWLSCWGFRRWNLYYHEGLKGRNTVNSIFKVILWKLLISFFQGFALYSEALGITSFYLLGFIWGFFFLLLSCSSPLLLEEDTFFPSLFSVLNLFCSLHAHSPLSLPVLLL